MPPFGKSCSHVGYFGIGPCPYPPHLPTSSHIFPPSHLRLCHFVDPIQRSSRPSKEQRSAGSPQAANDARPRHMGPVVMCSLRSVLVRSCVSFSPSCSQRTEMINFGLYRCLMIFIIDGSITSIILNRSVQLQEIAFESMAECGIPRPFSELVH